MGQNMDKRSYRREHSDLYSKLIQYYRDEMEDSELTASPTTKETPAEKDEVVKVYIRKRPLFEREIKAGEYDVVTCKPHEIVVHDCRMHPSMKPNLAYVESYKFPYPNTEVFNEKNTTDDVYNSAVKPLVNYVMEGNISTMFCFGQTGSGKTFTITGLVKLLSQDLFSQITKQGSKYTVTATCIELIGENCFDLLNDHTEVSLREGKTGEVAICGNKLCSLNNGSELFELYQYAAGLRETHATKINSNSSRSHYICRVFIDNSETGKQFARLTLCDLAGSERNSDSNEHDIERLKETAQINSSLMALKEVIRCVALNKEDSKVHIPYRGSKLTRMLKDCFEAEEKKQKRPHTVVVATVSPIACDTEHTINTLKHTCIMMSADSNMEGEKMVVQDVLGDDPYKKRTNVLKPISKWTYEEAIEWIGSIQKGKFKKYVSKFPTTMDGKALSRFPDKRLQQILGNDNLGLELRKEMMNYTDKCNQQKKQFAEENRKSSK